LPAIVGNAFKFATAATNVTNQFRTTYLGSYRAMEKGRGVLNVLPPAMFPSITGEYGL
jgi:hypothetical protein